MLSNIWDAIRSGLFELGMALLGGPLIIVAAGLAVGLLISWSCGAFK